jgi:hypothetical protein
MVPGFEEERILFRKGRQERAAVGSEGDATVLSESRHATDTDRRYTRTCPRLNWSTLMTRTWSVMLPVLVLGAAAIAAAAEALRLDSAWSPEPPTVDGKLTEWSSPLVTLGQTKLSLGVRNDGQSVYVALAASDQATRMMLGAAGFTVWFDPAGKEKKTFGITVPPTMKGPGMRGRGPGSPSDAQGQPAGPGGQSGPGIGTITAIEVAGPSKDDRRRLELAYARTIGLDVAARVAEGVLVYELRLPLAVSEAQPYGAKSSPGATIGLGIETSELPKPGGRGEEGGGGRGRGGMGGGPPGGGGGGGMGGGMGGGGSMGGGGMPGGMGGPPDGGRGEMREMKPIKTWATVRLAKGPA